MARRASSRISPVTLILCAVLVIGAIGAGSFFLGSSGNPYRGIQPLDTAAYLDNANSLQGNIYRIDGVVQNSLAWSSTKGRLISVEIKKEGDSGGPSEVIGIFVPAEFNHINIQKGQRYQFKVEVVKEGVIQARDLRKS